MREIRFRVWTGKEYRYPPNMYEWDTEDCGFFLFYMHDGCIIEQFTGLHGKNGKEIYEGDVLLVDGFMKKVVKWVTNASKECWGHGCYGISITSGFGVDASDEKSFEVIGNIHENPELING